MKKKERLNLAILLLFAAFVLVAIALYNPEVSTELDTEPTLKETPSFNNTQAQEKDVANETQTKEKPVVNKTEEETTHITKKEKPGGLRISKLTFFKGISNPQNTLDTKKVTLRRSLLIQEDSKCRNSFSCGYILNLTDQTEKLRIDTFCKDQNDNKYGFSDLDMEKNNFVENIYGESDEFGAMFYLQNKNTRIKCVINSPSKISSEWTSDKDTPIYLEPGEGTYSVVYGFSGMADVEEDRTLDCYLNISTEDQSITENFQLQYIYNS